MKKQSSFTNIFVYFIIAILLFIIIMPPLFRTLLKEPNKIKKSELDSHKIEALNCKKEAVVANLTYNLYINSNYQDGEISKITFIYQVPVGFNSNDITNPLVIEMNTLKESNLATSNITDNKYTFVVTKEKKDQNPSVTSLDGYFNPLETQKTNLETLGYTCSVLSV